MGEPQKCPLLLPASNLENRMMLFPCCVSELVASTHHNPKILSFKSVERTYKYLYWSGTLTPQHTHSLPFSKIMHQSRLCLFCSRFDFQNQRHSWSISSFRLLPRIARTHCSCLNVCAELVAILKIINRHVEVFEFLGTTNNLTSSATPAS
jgi:hypothetical protein